LARVSELSWDGEFALEARPIQSLS
jgi:hypothetical protein